MKKRHRFMAGKALKDVNNLNKCSACGSVKRTHLLCPYCVQGMLLALAGKRLLLTTLVEIKDMWRGKGQMKEGGDVVSS